MFFFLHKVNVNIFPDKPEQILSETYQSNIYVTNTNWFYMTNTNKF